MNERNNCELKSSPRRRARETYTFLTIYLKLLLSKKDSSESKFREDKIQLVLFLILFTKYAGIFNFSLLLNFILARENLKYRVVEK